MNNKILLIYTGGTIGMVNDPVTNSLVPLNFKHITSQVPEINNFDCQIDSYEFESPIDSSNVNIEFWKTLVSIIKQKYQQYDGFVILHGTDTMAHTASALSFMIQNINKPIILTGSQLPIGTIRTDGKENLITSIEVALAKHFNKPVVNEVCVCFENKLFRGNRVSKVNAEYFNAFSSENYPVLADIGIHINYNESYFLKSSEKTPIFNDRLDPNVAVMKVFPGMTNQYVNAFFNIPNLKALIIETYGAGNAPTDEWFLELLKQAEQKNIVLVNVTQCKGGSVNMGQYETSTYLKQIGMVSAHDMTIEATLTKLMFLMGNGATGEILKKAIEKPISGEIY
ncbi:MAG: asparaginase [Bacteroidales bacterium]|nr:asparaginase [Bacteroidales bacterium]